MARAGALTWLWIFLTVAACSAQVAEPAVDPARWEEIEVEGRVYYAVPDQDVRATGMPWPDIPREDNAAYVYLRAMQALPPLPEDLADAFNVTTAQPWGREQVELYRWFERTADARQLAADAASMDKCRFPLLDFEPGPVFLFALWEPHWKSMRQLAELAAAEGEFLEHEGDFKRALRSYVRVLRLAGHQGKEPQVIPMLVGCVAHKIGCRAILSCLQRQDLPIETLEWLGTELADTDRQVVDPVAWIAGERAQMVQVMRLPLSDLCSVSESVAANPAAMAFLNSRAARIFYPDRTLLRDVEGFFDALEQANRQPPWTAVSQLARDSGTAFVAEHMKDWNVLGLMLYPALGRVPVEVAKVLCDHSALRIIVALRLHRQRKGEWPDRLEQLVPECLADLPPDPFSGEPFHYRREGDGWLFYSVGADQKDDGGVLDEEAAKLRGAEPGAGNDENADIVYRSSKPEEP